MNIYVDWYIKWSLSISDGRECTSEYASVLLRRESTRLLKKHGAEVCKSCRFWKCRKKFSKTHLKFKYFLAKFGFDTAENGPAKILQKFANFDNPSGACSSPQASLRRSLPHLAGSDRLEKSRAEGTAKDYQSKKKAGAIGFVRFFLQNASFWSIG